MAKRGGNRSYDWDTKVAAARDHVDRGVAKSVVMERYAIACVTTLEAWCRAYRAGGAEALRPGPGGRRGPGDRGRGRSRIRRPRGVAG
ncbi:helix-turn-helix domain-containing protein, partial [Bifidobacterium scardovii]|uniref:helix-turn-helix domain-containing protein n=1 Tax=Bifidobacterium scardovii TaxID=158787 RepID=UPI003B503F45